MKTTRTYFANKGEALQEFSYDAWGNSRDPYTWTGSNANRCMFDRGFTGHEHLYDFGLINMNGRCYDPVMSSFLSVDRYVQNPSNSQNFNRYSYCLNNPLKYVDPSGWYMNEPYMASYPTWGDGMNQLLEPRDAKDGSPFMVNYYLSGGGNVSYGGGGGGSSTVSFGFAVNNPQYTVEQQCALIRKWQKDPSWLNRWMMQKAGLSDINRGEVYVNGIRNTYLSWEYNGVSHTASVENEYVGGRGLWCQTVSDIGGRGSYMPPGYNYSGSGLCGSNPNPSQGMVMTLAMQEQISLHTTTTSSVAGIVDLAAKLANDGTLDGISRTASRTGRALGIIGLAPSLYNLINNRNFENAARFIIPGIAIGIGFVAAPWAAAASLGITLVDACGGFDWFYDCAGELDRNP